MDTGEDNCSLVHGTSIRGRGFFASDEERLTIISFGGVFMSFPRGAMLCYSVVDTETGAVVGHDFRGSVTRACKFEKVGGRDTVTLGEKIADGPFIRQIETREPNGLVGEGYPSPSWKPGTICMTDKDFQLLYVSEIKYVPVARLVATPMGVAFGSKVLDELDCILDSAAGLIRKMKEESNKKPESGPDPVDSDLD